MSIMMVQSEVTLLGRWGRGYPLLLSRAGRRLLSLFLAIAKGSSQRRPGDGLVGRGQQALQRVVNQKSRLA